MSPLFPNPSSRISPNKADRGLISGQYQNLPSPRKVRPVPFSNGKAMIQLQPLELPAVQESGRAEDRVSDRQKSVKSVLNVADEALKSSRNTMKAIELDVKQQ